MLFEQYKLFKTEAPLTFRLVRLLLEQSKLNKEVLVLILRFVKLLSSQSKEVKLVKSSIPVKSLILRLLKCNSVTVSIAEV